MLVCQVRMDLRHLWMVEGIIRRAIRGIMQWTAPLGERTSMIGCMHFVGREDPLLMRRAEAVCHRKACCYLLRLTHGQPGCYAGDGAGIPMAKMARALWSSWGVELSSCYSQGSYHLYNTRFCHGRDRENERDFSR